MILQMLSWIYGAATKLRNWWYDSGRASVYHSPLAVVSVGNLTAGGNAKTPLCIYLARELGSRGMRPVILSRGYKGKQRGPHVVRSSDQAVDVGDEPLMLFGKTGMPVVVSADRVAGAKFIEAQKLGDVIILDDGFQHRRLGRTVDIVSINCGDEISISALVQGRLLPWGAFREDRDRALRRPKIVVLVERQISGSARGIDPRILSLIPRDKAIYQAGFEAQGVVDRQSGELLPRQQVVAFCGIANPHGFFSSLESLGYHVTRSYVFPDHHQFTSADFARIRSEAGETQPLVCTEKDAIRIPTSISGVFVLPVELRLRPGDSFITQLTRLLLQSRSQAPIREISARK